MTRTSPRHEIGFKRTRRSIEWDLQARRCAEGDRAPGGKIGAGYASCCDNFGDHAALNSALTLAAGNFTASTGAADRGDVMFKVPDNRGLLLKPVEPLGKSGETVRPSDLSSPSTDGTHTRPYDDTGAQAWQKDEADVRTMIVGPGVSVSGTISSCSRLILEGTIDAKLDDCQHVIVARTGVFKGDVSTDNADVHGRFEGDLIVRKRLMVRASGQVSGRLTYGEIEIERGGKISGAIRAREGGSTVSYSRPARTSEDPFTGSPQATELPLSMRTNGSAPHLAVTSSPIPAIDVGVDR